MNKHYHFAWFNFYDRDRVQQKLEQMAREGWEVEKTGNFLWKYHKMEPRERKFTVTYFPDASAYDAKPTEAQQLMEEYCAYDGWQVQHRWVQMQIFYSDEPNPRPIETDPVVQVETIHQAMRKSAVPSLLMLAGLLVYLVCLFAWQFHHDPVAYLASPVNVFLPLIYAVAVLVPLLGIIEGELWYKKAALAAQQGEFYGTARKRTLYAVLDVVEGLLTVWMFMSISNGFGAWLMGLGMVLVMFFLASRFQEWVIRRGYSRRKTMAVSITGVVILTAVLLVGMGYGIFTFGMIGDKKPVATHDVGGYTVKIYADELPLYLQDYLDVPEAEWSTEARPTTSPLVERTAYQQWAFRSSTQPKDIPDLQYTITEVKAKGLYDFCKDSLLREEEDLVIDGEVVDIRHYESTDPEVWGAEEAYVVVEEYDLRNRYLLCYPGKLVELHLDEAPTPEQMALIGEKLTEA